MRPEFKLHHNEPPSMAMTRLFKYIRALKKDYKPQSRAAATVRSQKAMKPKLRIVK
jgi:hypothetical protein